MRNILILAAIATAATSSFATKCPDGKTDPSQHPDGNCNWFYEGTQPSANATSADAQAQAKAQAAASVGNVSQRQQQQQLQQQQQSLRNSNSSVSGGANVTISGAAEGSGDRNSYVAWAPIIHGPAAPAIASANLVVVPGVCGPRVRVITTQVMGEHYGPAGGQYEKVRGYSETIGPWLNDDGNPGAPFVWRDGFMLGHMVTQAWSTLGTSSSASFSVGGFVDSKGLQGGAAGSGAVQQLVKGLQVMDCVMPTERPVVVPQRAVARPIRRPVRRVAPVAVAPCALQCVPTRSLLGK